MNLQLTGHQLDITPAIRGYVTTKLERITRHFDHVIDVSVILSVEKLEQKVEANVHVPGGDIFCESSDEDMVVIVGLMVQMVITGQQLIQNARVRDIMAQQSAVETAVMAFQDRYHQLPGDYAGASANIPCDPSPCMELGVYGYVGIVMRLSKRIFT